MTIVRVPCFDLDAGNSDYHNAYWIQMGWWIVLFGRKA